MKQLLRVCAFITLTADGRVGAVPPLVSGDVPTAEKGTFELYLGMSYESERGFHQPRGADARTELRPHGPAGDHP